MSLATTTDTAAIKTVPLSKYEIQRNERHAEAQGRSDAKRRGKNAPRRDDMARAAYYVLLMMFNAPKVSVEERAQLRGATTRMLKKAGFDRGAARDIFTRHAAGVIDDLDGWLAQRWYAEGRRLNDNRGPYVSVKQTPARVALIVAKPAADLSAAE
ncbi:hypothetical protein FV226_22790 [Methylobacterium sp. WL12]|uniref:hypothetical protein n=1 Tax=Methylobacterium sp. WL12 TaxID=2603890 RepID=UPI0011CCA72F|nr:hypothetical protein [Methylobacterium sp. WL12]TXM66908.1 hypothetical protein FV226_22790 [Methylobacterium sp. WL12]